jgi:hypothetical protein
VFVANSLFSPGWRHGSGAKYIVLKNLEAKFLKMENIRGAVRASGLDEMLRRAVP